ncbi:MAG: hypothetical protein LBM04_12400 [Opitutaceae bacterium]|nr:hypothetical protein [Opitutaceae bacterium]
MAKRPGNGKANKNGHEAIPEKRREKHPRDTLERPAAHAYGNAAHVLPAPGALGRMIEVEGIVLKNPGCVPCQFRQRANRAAFATIRHVARDIDIIAGDVFSAFGADGRCHAAASRFVWQTFRAGMRRAAGGVLVVFMFPNGFCNGWMQCPFIGKIHVWAMAEAYFFPTGGRVRRIWPSDAITLRLFLPPNPAAACTRWRGIQVNN